MSKYVLYVCDGHGCDRDCASIMSVDEWKHSECHHTPDIAHAVNFERLNDGNYAELMGCEMEEV